MFSDYQIACGFQRRSSSLIRTVREIVQSKIFGNLISVQYDFGSQHSIIIRDKFHSNFQLAGGGILFDSGIHGVDTIVYCTDPIKTKMIYANVVLEGGMDIHTYAKFDLTIEGGETIDCFILVTSLKDSKNGFTFKFENAIISFSFSSENISLFSKDVNQSFLLTKNRMYPKTPYQILYEHWFLFLHGLISESANQTSAYCSLFTSSIIGDIYSSNPKESIKVGP